MTELAEVHLIGLPVDEHQLAMEHLDDLLREFALLRATSDVDEDVPARLLELRSEVSLRFKLFLAASSGPLRDAVAQGAISVDLVYRVPPEAATAAVQLLDLLDEADEYCRSGAHILTLAMPERSVRYRRWILGQFVRQIAGEAPEPWADHVAQITGRRRGGGAVAGPRDAQTVSGHRATTNDPT